MREWDGQALARIREALYRFFSASFLPPEPAHTRDLKMASRALGETGIEALPFFVPWDRMCEALDRAEAGQLERNHLALFLVGPQGTLCPANESSYVGDGSSTSEVLASVQRAYHRLGLSVANDSGNLPDHLSVELSAMAHVCDREAHAWGAEDAAKATGLLRLEGEFLRAHPARWLPSFSSRIGKVAAPGFYPLAAEAASAFVHQDVEIVRLLTEVADG